MELEEILFVEEVAWAQKDKHLMSTLICDFQLQIFRCEYKT